VFSVPLCFKKKVKHRGTEEHKEGTGEIITCFGLFLNHADFWILLNRFSTSNYRGNITLVYDPYNLNRKAAKIIPKIDEPLVSKEVYLKIFIKTLNFYSKLSLETNLEKYGISLTD